MTATYLIEKLRERRRTIEASRRHSQGVISDVADMLSPNEKLLSNKGVQINVNQSELTAALVDLTQAQVDVVALSVDEEGELWLGDRLCGSQADAQEIYREFSDLLARKMPVDQLMK